MSNNRLRFTGLDELRASLRRLPADLRDDAQVIVFEKATAAGDDILAGYAKHDKTGELSQGLQVQQLSGGGTAFAGSIIQNKSKIAFIFENGSQTRQTASGANRGSMPPAHIFIPAVIRRRREMYDELRAMMQTHGLKVVG